MATSLGWNKILDSYFSGSNIDLMRLVLQKVFLRKSTQADISNCFSNATVIILNALFSNQHAHIPVQFTFRRLFKMQPRDMLNHSTGTTQVQ